MAATQLQTAELADSSVSTGKIAAGAVTTAKIAASAVTSNELGAAAVVAGKIATGGISAAGQFAAGVVDSAALGTGAVTAGKIGTGGISAADQFAATRVPVPHAEHAVLEATDIVVADADMDEAPSEEEQPVAFCLRISGSPRRALVDTGLDLCRSLAGSVEFSEPPTAWDGADWTIRGTGRLSAVQAACACVEGASVSAA